MTICHHQQEALEQSLTEVRGSLESCKKKEKELAQRLREMEVRSDTIILRN